MSEIQTVHWLLLSLLAHCPLARLKSRDPKDPLLLCKAGLAENKSSEQLERLAGFLADQGSLLLPDFLKRKIKHSLKWADAPEHSLLPLDSPHYPDLLKQIPDPPALLYVWGNPESVGLPQVAMVGTRKPTAAGVRLARQFSSELAASGYSICSGLAYGIDKESHLGALNSGNKTIAVLGSGHSHLYPRRHQVLAEQIAEHHAVLSEFAPDTAPKAWHFPLRNRLISGLSHGVLVVEAAVASGSLVTARHAADQGRTVFAVPGMIQNPMSRGCHHLIRHGAVLVEKTDDILDELHSMFHWECDRLPANARPSESPTEMSEARSEIQIEEGVERGVERTEKKIPETAQKILQQIAYNPLTADALADNLNIEVQSLLPMLLEMEMAGLLIYSTGTYVKL